ncbi:telomere repeat binding factor-domain-containing protein [Lipomyces tetrasporus]|uniref:Telomere repeat binding factor-domain-containing protein n=1 Tax=Lipomyces tetrasporus TaxID=54092 RepID=A0AAD7QMA3_9ASCO|nr:telomere repeat binding factor-domain-containing protein [Lipomyces tetrasporus]KAJ8097506.1 telomere repeat binding factor-domain-containing protein [Lipomyces tetrasporus]
MITVDVDSLDVHVDHGLADNEATSSNDPHGQKRAHEETERMFDLNDAEQLRFIAEQLENVSGANPVSMEEEIHHEDSYDFALDDFTSSQDPSMQLKVQSMPILDNLSSQILTTLGRGTYQDTFNVVTQPESDQGQAYRTLTSLFDQTKKLYTHDAFLSASTLGFSKSPRYRSIIRKANLATFVSSVFGSTEVGFFHLNEYFLDSFVPDGARLLKSQGALYLDLKTQAFISAMGQGERSKEEILDDLFPEDLDQLLVTRRHGARSLTPSEQDFIARCKSRKEILAATDQSENLSEKYVWQDFLKDISEYVSKNYQTLTVLPPQTASKRPRRSNVPDTNISNFATGSNVVHASPVVPAAVQQNTEATASSEIPVDPIMSGDTSAAGGYPAGGASVGPTSPPARAKSGRNRALNNGSSRRRPWTKEEETALMQGLDEVKGPRWSQILEMYGPGGRISEVLKDRNQVQLKDKARNLKLFFLKSGLQVPYYLKFVTGELKSRGGKRQQSAEDSV